MKTARVGWILWRADSYWGSAVGLTRRGAIRRVRRLPYRIDNGWVFLDQRIPAPLAHWMDRRAKGRR